MIKRVKFVISILMIVLLFSVVLAGCSKGDYPNWQNYEYVENGDMDIVKNRMVQSLYDDKIEIDFLEKIQNDGSFSDVDYYSNLKDYWHPIDHLKRVRAMCIAYYTPNHLYYNNQSVLEKIYLALDYWVEKDFYCEWNGWWNDIGIGTELGDIMIFPLEDISKNTKDLLNDKLYKCSIIASKVSSKVTERLVNDTGGNLTDKVIFSMKYALSTNQGSLMMFLKALMDNELRVFPNHQLFVHKWNLEGIKADMSFQQHFDMLYFGGYGEVFANGVNTYLELTKDTQFSLSKNAIKVYTDFILDGMQYAFRGEYRDINASGRGIVRENELKGISREVENATNILLDYDIGYRKDNLEKVLSDRFSYVDNGAGGHKYFFTSDYQVYNGKKYMASVRHASKRTKNSEALNGENVLGHYLGAGATFYYVDGSEYYNAMPTMDWNKVPGTTAVQGYLPIGGDETYTRRGKTSFVGGVSNGNIGFSFINYNDNNVVGKKAYFMFEDAVICLGSGISSSRNGDVYTTINQTLLDNASYSVNGSIVNAKYMNYNGKIDWAYNNGIGYITNNTVTIKAQNVSGDYKTISTRVNSKVVSNDMYEIGISHGNFARQASYEYTVLPNYSIEEVKRYKENPRYIVLANTDSIQAVMDSVTGEVQAVFYKGGVLSAPKGKIRALNSCGIMISDGKMYLSDPYQKNRRVAIMYDGKNYIFNFDKGLDKGKTIVKNIK